MKSKALFLFTWLSLILIVALPAHGEGAPPGLTGGPLENSDATFESIVDGIFLGQSVAIAGDVNGDGYADVLIGQPGDDEISNFGGMVTLFLGGPEGWSNYMSSNEADAIFRGEADGDWAGFSVSGAGDFNGDGFDDIIVGAPKRNGDEGAAYLILGREVWADVDLSAADALFAGAGVENAGWNVAAAGDLNDDHLGDVVIGAPGFNSSQGRAYVLFGNVAPADRMLANSDVVLDGEAAGDQAGFSVAGAANVDGDRYDDLLIGAPNYGSGDGRVYLVTDFQGGPFPLARNLSAADRIYFGTTGQSLGWSVDLVGDMNGDGFGDMLAGFTTTTGGAYLVLGASSPKANCTLDFCTDQGYRGAVDSSTGGRVAAVGDVNGDGYGDLLIGACAYSGGNNQGRASLILGEPNPTGVVDLDTEADAHFIGMNALDSTCVAQNGAGDINGDGLSDLVIGSPGHFNNRGRAYLQFADETTSVSARYRLWYGTGYGRIIGQSGVTALMLVQDEYGTVYATRHFRGSCNSARDTNGLLWRLDSQLGQDAELQFIFKYNNSQIAGWNEPDLQLWYRDRPCQDWTLDAGAGLDVLTNRITSTPVIDPHREYTISPVAPSPTQLGLTGTGAFLSPTSTWPVLLLVVLILSTIGADWWHRRSSMNRSP